MSMLKYIATASLTFAVVQAAPIKSNQSFSVDFTYDETSIDDKEFEYFYNYELLNKLELLTENKTMDDEDILEKLAKDELEYEDTTELDVILDQLLEGGNLIEEVLNEIETEFSNTSYDNLEMDTLDQVIFLAFLVSFILMFLISSCVTSLHYCGRKSLSEGTILKDSRRMVDFVLVPNKNNHEEETV